MTDYYVYSGATGGTYNGQTEGTAWQNISDATGLTDGDRLLVHHQHAVNFTDTRSWAPGNSAHANNPIICMSCDWGNSYAYTPGAYEKGTVGTSTPDTTLGGKNIIWMGIDLLAMDYLTLGNPSGPSTIIDGLLGTARTNGTSFIQQGTQGGTLTLINSDMEFHSTPSGITSTSADGIFFQWRGGSLIAGTNTVTNLFSADVNAPLTVFDVRGVDLSAASAFTNLVTLEGGVLGAGALSELSSIFRFVGCKMPASFTFVNDVSTASGLWRAEMIGCDDGTLTDPAYNYRHEENSGKSETVLTHYRTGGADDGFQANGYSVKVDGYAKTKKHFRQAAVKIPLSVYVGTTGAKTFRVHFAHAGNGSGTGGLYQDNEVWLESEGPPETTATALMAVKSSCSTYGGTISDLTNETGETWNGTGVGTKQSVEIAYTTQLEGMAYFTLCFAPEAAETIYVDPKVEVL